MIKRFAYWSETNLLTLTIVLIGLLLTIVAYQYKLPERTTLWPGGEIFIAPLIIGIKYITPKIIPHFKWIWSLRKE